MTHKCSWCYRECLDCKKVKLQFRDQFQEVEVCSSECEKTFSDFVSYADKNFRKLVLLILISLVLGLIVTFWRIKIDYGALGVLIIFMGPGLALIKYPFVTPQTVERYGGKKAVFFGRVLGLVNMLIGVVFWFVLAKVVP